jgi:hypothetical protein
MAPPAEVLLAEYKALKSEQQSRIGTRDNLLYAAFTAMAAVIAAVFTSRLPAVLLAGPPVMEVLGWTYLSNDIKVTQIGDYIRRELGPLLGDGAFGWEQDGEHPGRRRARKLFQLIADAVAFCVLPSGLALMGIIGQALRPGVAITVLVVAAALAEVSGAAAIGWMLARYASLEPKVMRKGAQ